MLNHCLGSNKHNMSESSQLSFLSLWTIQKPFPTNEGRQFALESWDLSCVFLLGYYQQPQHLKRNTVCNTWICALNPWDLARKMRWPQHFANNSLTTWRVMASRLGFVELFVASKLPGGFQTWYFHGRDDLMFIMKGTRIKRLNNLNNQFLSWDVEYFMFKTCRQLIHWLFWNTWFVDVFPRMYITKPPQYWYNIDACMQLLNICIIANFNCTLRMNHEFVNYPFEQLHSGKLTWLAGTWLFFDRGYSFKL